MLYKGVDLFDQLFDAAEGAPDRALGDQPEPTLHLIEPRGIGRGVVDVEAWAVCQPGTHLGMFVGAVVVDDLRCSRNSPKMALLALAAK